jgi:hypothetical protein
MRIALAAFCLAAQLLSGAALAQTASEMAACKADYEKFCTGVSQGGGRILKCLTQHMSDLTPDCQKVVKENTPG